MRACWDTMVLAPPLTISKKEIDEIGIRARKTLDDTLKVVQHEMV